MNALDHIQENLRRLKLHRMAEILETRPEEAVNNRCYTDFLDELLDEKVSAKREKNLSMGTNMAQFSVVKTLESFDFHFQPSVDKKCILKLAACWFIANGENVVLLGPPRVGKTHLAVGLALKAISEGYATGFTQAMSLIASLTKAYAENRLEERGQVLLLAAAAHYRRDRLHPH
jgi:DNA replication protein DnaC